MAVLSNEWLSSVLLVNVASFSVRTLQEGITTGHLKVIDVDAAEGQKLCVVLKETRLGADGKQLSKVMGLPRESLFYNHFAPKLASDDIARIYHATGSLETGETSILMEDLSRGVQSGYFFGPGNPMNWGKDLEAAITKGNNTSSREMCTLAFCLAARLHGTFFRSKDLLGHHWLKGCKWVSGEDQSGWSEKQMQTRELWTALKATIDSGEAEVKWSTEVVDVIDASVHKASQENSWSEFVATLQGQPWTLLHGDFHPGNMIFLPEEQGSGGSLKLVDWEMVGVGSGPQDLAQYLISHATPELRKGLEEELLSLYHCELQKTVSQVHGSETGSAFLLEQCKAEYVAGGVGKWVWLMVQMGGGMRMPASVMQFFHDQLHAFVVDHNVHVDKESIPPPRV